MKNIFQLFIFITILLSDQVAFADALNSANALTLVKKENIAVGVYDIENGKSSCAGRDCLQSKLDSRLSFSLFKSNGSPASYTSIQVMDTRNGETVANGSTDAKGKATLTIHDDYYRVMANQNNSVEHVRYMIFADTDDGESIAYSFSLTYVDQEKLKRNKTQNDKLNPLIEANETRNKKIILQTRQLEKNSSKLDAQMNKSSICGKYKKSASYFLGNQWVRLGEVHTPKDGSVGAVFKYSEGASNQVDVLVKSGADISILGWKISGSTTIGNTQSDSVTKTIVWPEKRGGSFYPKSQFKFYRNVYKSKCLFGGPRYRMDIAPGALVGGAKSEHFTSSYNDKYWKHVEANKHGDWTSYEKGSSYEESQRNGYSVSKAFTIGISKTGTIKIVEKVKDLISFGISTSYTMKTTTSFYQQATMTYKFDGPHSKYHVYDGRYGNNWKVIYVSHIGNNTPPPIPVHKVTVDCFEKAQKVFYCDAYVTGGSGQFTYSWSASGGNVFFQSGAFARIRLTGNSGTAYAVVTDTKTGRKVTGRKFLDSDSGGIKP